MKGRQANIQFFFFAEGRGNAATSLVTEAGCAMRDKKRADWWSTYSVPIIVVVIPTVLGVASLVTRHVVPELSAKWNAPQRQRFLLYSADHQAILEAGRTLLVSARDVGMPWDVESVWGRAPDWKGAPEAVKALHPRSVVLMGRDSATIFCGASSHEYGLTVYAPRVPQSGTKKILDGLWYFDRKGEIPEP